MNHGRQSEIGPRTKTAWRSGRDWSVVDDFSTLMGSNAWTMPTAMAPSTVTALPTPPSASHLTPECDNIIIPTPHLHSTLPRKQTALVRAVRADNGSMVRMLVSRGANPEQLDETGLTPLHIAVQNGQDAMVDLLLELSNPNVRDRQGRSVLFGAVANQNETMVKKLLNGLVDPNQADDRGDLPLHSAVDMGSGALACLLIDHGAVVDA